MSLGKRGLCWLGPRSRGVLGIWEAAVATATATAKTTVKTGRSANGGAAGTGVGGARWASTAAATATARRGWVCRGCRQSSTLSSKSTGIQRPRLHEGSSLRVAAASASPLVGMTGARLPGSRRHNSTDRKEDDDVSKEGVDRASMASNSSAASSPSMTSSPTITGTRSSGAQDVSISSASAVPPDGSTSPANNASQLPPPDELPSQEERRRLPITRRFTSVMDNLQANIFFAGQRLNDLTGYSGIEALKRDIETLERTLRGAQAELSASKGEYSRRITERSDSQREVNELLQRKNSWSGADLERFTALYRSDHANEQAESEARARLDAAERAADEAAARLSAKILSRYHEEQIWSDKIRRMSTWGTWGLMGVNVLLFLVFQIGVEPWRRQRLVRGFEEKVREALEDSSRSHLVATGEALTALQQQQQQQQGSTSRDGMTTTGFWSSSSDSVETADVAAAVDQVISAEVLASEGIDGSGAEAVLTDTIELVPTSGGQGWKWLPDWRTHWRRGMANVDDLFSSREVTVRQVELTQKALEGVFFGVMITSVVATLVRGR